MKKELSKIAKDLEQDTITENEARALLLDLLIVSESTLNKYGLTIDYAEYGIYKLRQNGEYLMEGEKHECYDRAREIVDRYSR